MRVSFRGSGNELAVAPTRLPASVTCPLPALIISKAPNLQSKHTPRRYSRTCCPPVIRVEEMASPPRTGRRLVTLLCFLVSCVALTGASRSSRRDLDVNLGGGGGGISIGIGGGGSPPPSSSEPRPCDFENERLYRAYLVIQKFRKTVKCDPMGVTRTWTGTDLCSSYKGFFCDQVPGIKDRTIASVDVNGYRLRSDSLEGFVNSLPDLALFHANSNDFGGAVPSLKNLQYFYELDLSNNNLAPAKFPTEVLGITNATFVDIRFNNFFGELPAGVFSSFRRVEAIFVNNNQFSGSLPANIGDSPVNYLSLANNKFTGEIPKSIARNAGTLREVLFLNNSLSGCLPYELGLLAKATVIDTGTNRLTGYIPASFACLHEVEQLNLANNLLYGHVPDELCNLAYPWAGRLKNLTLSGNYFTSLGFCCWDLVKQGRLNIDGNCILWAPNQRSYEECADFLLHHPKCPLDTYQPCKPKYFNSGEQVHASTEELAALEEYKYRTYSSLHP